MQPSGRSAIDWFRCGEAGSQRRTMKYTGTLLCCIVSFPVWYWKNTGSLRKQTWRSIRRFLWRNYLRSDRRSLIFPITHRFKLVKKFLLYICMMYACINVCMQEVVYVWMYKCKQGMGPSTNVSLMLELFLQKCLIAKVTISHCMAFKRLVALRLATEWRTAPQIHNVISVTFT